MGHMPQAMQLKVTLPALLYNYLNSKADRYGLTMSSYVKNLILNDVKQVDYPTYEASEATEVSYKKALKNKKSAVVVHDVGAYFKKL